MKYLITPFFALLLTPFYAHAWERPDFALSDVPAGLSKPFERVPDPDDDDLNILEIQDFGATADDDSDDDAEALRKALNAAKPGDVISFAHGDYHFKTPVRLKTGVSLYGGGNSMSAPRIIARLEGSGNYLLLVPSSAEDIRISGFHFTRDGGTEIDDMIEIGTSSGANAKRIELSKLVIENHHRRGINVRNAEHVLIEEVTVRNATALGGGGQGYGIVLNNPGNNNNWIRYCTLGPVLRHGVLIQYGAHHNLIEYCEGFDTTHDTFDLHGEGEYGNEFRYNRVSGSGGAGFGVGNTGGGPPPHDEAGPNNWIHDNEVTLSREGVYFRSSEDPTLNTYIERNYFHHNQYGIRLMAAELNSGSSGDSTFVRNNIIYANTSDGIYAQISNDLLIEGNFITHNGGDGLDFRAGVQDYVVRNNDLRFNKGSPLNAAAQATGEFEASNVTDNAAVLPTFVFAGDDASIEQGAYVLKALVVDQGVPFPEDLQYEWTFNSDKEDVVDFDDVSDPRTKAYIGAPGLYVLRLTAGEASDEVMIRLLGATPTGWTDSITGWIFWDFFPWIFHLDHGYLYFTGENYRALESQFAYYPEGDLGWVYLDLELYPYLYSYGRESWLYYLRDEGQYPKGRWFWDFKVGAYFDVPPEL